MIAVETVIRKLIGEYEFVIIPGFGALLSHQVPAVFDGNSGIFAPPVKRLAFNEYLKLDDGLLANYISRHEKVTHADAVEYIKGYTDRLRSGLDVNGEASITGIGEFKQNVEGKLVFEPNTGKYFKDEWFGFEKIKAVEVQARPVAALNSAQYISDDVEVVELETEARPRRWTGWAAAAVIAGLLCGLSFFLVNTENEYIKSTLNPFADMFSRKEAVETTVVNNEEAKTPQPSPVMEEVVAKVDSMPVDSAPVNAVEPVATTPAPAPVVAETKPAEIATAKFYVIAGAFKGTKQANVLLAQLNEKGFTKALIIPGDERSKKVKVAVDGFDNETDAYRASAKLKAVIGEAGWVYKKK
ncbi:Sporulation related domain-containing protein [Dyadobacter soli]|uniref:Sporulation related domain-containing protein n=1 Tax=Dyadobacter soli TaxID=659014 RepID=A0A1G7KPK9_9BACT|nr:SPOR domain-containing protein [Dyadobacter soli]SDF38880.1 Sporulation related domain-containing protein [Dyadobacter soli]